LASTRTLPELAKVAGVSESSARRYVKSFSEFIPGEHKGRLKVYPSEAVTVLKRIKQLYDSGYNTESVYDKLSEEFDRVIEASPAEGGGGDGPPPQENSNELQAQEVVKQLVSQIQERRFDDDIINMILNRLDALEKKMKDLEEEKRSWWSRFIGKK